MTAGIPWRGKCAVVAVRRGRTYVGAIPGQYSQPSEGMQPNDAEALDNLIDPYGRLCCDRDLKVDLNQEPNSLCSTYFPGSLRLAFCSLLVIHRQFSGV